MHVVENTISAVYKLITGRQQANELLNAPGPSTPKCKRDRAILGASDLVRAAPRRARWPRSRPDPALRGPLGHSGSCR
jgi:hypothetical protein